MNDEQFVREIGRLSAPPGSEVPQHIEVRMCTIRQRQAVALAEVRARWAEQDRLLRLAGWR